MQSREDFKSFISAKRKIPELTLRAVMVGALLAIILGSANAYFGLYAGMTVSAAIRRWNFTCCRSNIYHSCSCYTWNMD